MVHQYAMDSLNIDILNSDVFLLLEPNLPYYLPTAWGKVDWFPCLMAYQPL